MTTTRVSFASGKKPRPKYHGKNRRGRINIPSHTHPLVRQLVEELNDQLATFDDISDRSGVGIDTIRFWMTRHMPRLDSFEAAANALGLELILREKRN